MSSPQEKSSLKDFQTIEAMMRDLGLHEYDKNILNHLLEFNNRHISLILEKAKSCAKYANKDTVDVSDVQKAIQMAKDGAIPRFPSPEELKKESKESNKKLLITVNPSSGLRKTKNEAHSSHKNYKLKTHLNSGRKIWEKDIIIDLTGDEETAGPTGAIDNTNIPTQSDQKFEDLPVITDLDIEEVIGNIQSNEDVTTDTVSDFNVDSLLNDPYTL